MERIESLSQRYTPTLTPPRAALDPRRNPGMRLPQNQPGVLYEQIRAHRELLSAEGLLPRSFTPPVARPRPNSLLLSGCANQGHAHGRLMAPYSKPFAINVTAPLSPPADPEKALGFEYRLHRLPRDSSDASSARLRRKITLSRVILVLCMFFPPLLLLYGYGMLDGVIAIITDGKVTRLSHREKQVARYIGWGLAIGAIVGIIIGMIVIGRVVKP